MNPAFIMALAGALSANQGANDQRRAAATQYLQHAGSRLGGDSPALEAEAQKQAIERQRSNALTNVFINTLVGQLGQKQAPQGNEAWRGATTGAEQQSLLYPDANKGPLGAVRSDADERAQALGMARSFYGLR